LYIHRSCPGLINKKNDFKSSVKNDATESAIIRTKLDNIGQSVDSIRIDFKASDQRWTALSERVIRNEESTKQAHKRIDKIENKGEF
jgi:tetrahydromethanopterin S-methyltransferase subunit G